MNFAQRLLHQLQVHLKKAASKKKMIRPLMSSTLFSAAGTALPTCASGLKGDRRVVSDATSPTYMGAYTSGGGITTEVICSYNGTTYSWLTH